MTRTENHAVEELAPPTRGRGVTTGPLALSDPVAPDAPRQDRGWWLVYAGLSALLTACGAGEMPPTTFPSAQGMPALGRTRVPMPMGQTATNQAAFLARIQGFPKQVPSEARTFSKPGGSGQAMRYYLFKPRGLDPALAYPLVLSLHGGKPHEFEHLLEGGTLGFAYGVGRLVSPEEQAKHPAFVVAPWSGGLGWDEENLRLVKGLLQALAREFKLDTNRFYVTGQSMGGYGTWAIMAAYPDLFAAAIPICGGGDPASAGRIRGLPIWAFHGSGDDVVPVSETRDMIIALWRRGGRPSYWEYDGASHSQTAERAYCEPQLLEWLFAQVRK
jgi:poly(3-hydroxybutyrate) depolymerase